MEQFYYILETFQNCDHISKASNTSLYMKKKLTVQILMLMKKKDMPLA